MAWQSYQAAPADAIQIDPVVWQLDKDYPDSLPGDSSLPVHTVYIKTHDATDWMSTYDHHPQAISGPDSLRRLIDVYKAQNIEVAAWFDPHGRDLDGQVAMAKQVLDAGVTALYADVEPYSGFCDDDCDYLAMNFWWRLRSERPNAPLGVIYDPRRTLYEREAAAKWLAVADAALPMCYWESFAGQPPYDDPAGCVQTAYADLETLAPGRHLDYIPMLQGDSTAARFKLAVDAAVAVGSEKVSVWRRGVVPSELWTAMKPYAKPIVHPCSISLADGCRLRDPRDSSVYLIVGRAKFPYPVSAQGIQPAAIDAKPVESAPLGLLDSVPLVPVDGTLLQEDGDIGSDVIFGGARFVLPNPASFGALGLDPALVRVVPVGSLAQIPLVPVDGSRLKELSNPTQYLMANGGKIGIPSLEALNTLLLSGEVSPQLYIVPNGALSAIPPAVVKRGDADCNGKIDVVDALDILKLSADIPGGGLCVHQAGDVGCDGDIDAIDALLLLRRIASLDASLPQDCGPSS